MLPENALRFRYYARPGVLEAGDDAAGLVRQQQQQQQQGLTQPGGGAGGLAAPQMHMKRLGWSKLSLEPEHLTDRVVDALHSLDARYERAEATAESDDVFVVNAEISGVACRVLVTRDPNDDEAYRISCTRLGGDTFAYHDIFRQLREKLGDAVQGGVSMHGSGGGVRRARAHVARPRADAPCGGDRGPHRVVVARSGEGRPTSLARASSACGRGDRGVMG